MNNFCGKIPLLDGIALDMFTTSVIDSSAFFLSHFHTDHMKGLSESAFSERIQSPNVYLYCSAITGSFINNNKKYRHLTPKVKVLPLEEEVNITVPSSEGEDKEYVVVLLPAGHMPGSVMFFFETPLHNILYTGDFRLEVGSLSKFTYLHDNDGNVKPLHSLYIDTTFCTPRHMHFPKREDSVVTIVELIEEWLSKGDEHVIWFHCAGEYGAEFIYVELFKRLGLKVHVMGYKYHQYHKIDEITAAVTSNEGCRIHACGRDPPAPLENRDFQTEHRIPCSEFGNLKVRIIRPTSQWYGASKTKNDIKFGNKDETYFWVCYAMHSSATEILDFVQYLKPQHIHPIVKSNNHKEAQEMWDLLNSVMPKSEHKSLSLTDYQPDSLTALTTTSDKEESKSFDNPSFDPDCSSPELKKRKTNDSCDNKHSNAEHTESNNKENEPDTNGTTNWGFMFTPSPITSNQSSQNDIFTTPNTHPNILRRTPDNKVIEARRNLTLALSRTLEDQNKPESRVRNTVKNPPPIIDLCGDTTDEEDDENIKLPNHNTQECKEIDTGSDDDVICLDDCSDDSNSTIWEQQGRTSSPEVIELSDSDTFIDETVEVDVSDCYSVTETMENSTVYLDDTTIENTVLDSSDEIIETELIQDHFDTSHGTETILLVESTVEGGYKTICVDNSDSVIVSN